MSNNTGRKAFKDMLWRFGERICAQFVSFAVSIILARILLPAEYGIVAMTMVCISLCNVFVTSGFGAALVQKEHADDTDFSTVGLFGTAVSILLYLILYGCAPAIAAFYHEPVMSGVLRVMAVRLPLAAVNSVQQAYVARHGMFRKFFWSTLIGTLTSAAVGIIMAYAGYGIWALVAQYLVNSVMDTVVLGAAIRWFPGLRFSWHRLRSVFGFGWRILCSDLIGTAYNELRNLIIGKRYASEQLAFYNRGYQIPHVFVTNVGVALSSVLLPVMSQEQNDEKRLRSIAQRTIRTGTYIMFPLMAGLAVTAEPLVRFLLTDKWLPAVPFLRMACFSYALDPWATANLEALKARGKADDYLKLEIRKKMVAVLIMIPSIPLGVHALAASGCVYGVIAVAMTARQNQRSIQYGFGRQIRDIWPNIVPTALMGILIYLIHFLPLRPLALFILQVMTGIAAYVLLSVLMRNENYDYLKQLLKSFRAR